MSFAKQVWETFSAIDVEDHAKKIEYGGNSFSYLPWAKAWQIVMEHYPESQVMGYQSVQPCGSDSGWEIRCTVMIREGDDQLTREMDLPVMDHKNDSIMNPSSRDISDTRRRCMVKCLAHHFGLGLSLWAGDVAAPEYKPSYTPEQKDAFDDAVKMEESYQLFLMSKLPQKVWIDLYNSFPAGAKTAGKKVVNELLEKAQHAFDSNVDMLKQMIADEDNLGVVETVEEMRPEEKRLYWSRLDKSEQDYVKKAVQEAS